MTSISILSPVKRPKSDFYSLYKEIRNQARKYNTESIIRAAMRELDTPNPSSLEDLSGAPWQLLLLVKWVCQDGGQNFGAPDITREALYKIRQSIWSIPERLVDKNENETPGYLLIRQLLHPQSSFQRKVSIGFVRESSILLQENWKHPLRRMFKEKTGLRLNDFVDLTLSLYGGVINGKRTFPAAWFEPLVKKYSVNTINLYIQTISRTTSQLLSFCQSLPDSRKKVASELFEFPALARYPFLRTGGAIEFWHRAIFFRGMENIVHNIMSESGKDYIEPFSKMFERHALNEARQISDQFFTEETIKAWLPPQSKVPDGIASYPECNVFIEFKAGMFDGSVMTLGHAEIFSDRTRAIQDAFRQGWAASTGLRKHGLASEQVRSAQKDYLLVVTNREISTGRGTTFQKMCPPETLVPPDLVAATHLPIERIYILSLEDFERFAACVAPGDIDCPSFLESCVDADSSPHTSVYYFEQHLDRARAPYRCSKLVDQAIEVGTHRLEMAIGD